MDDRDPPFRNASAATPVWLGLIAALALIFAASLVRAADPGPYTGTVEPCLSGHGDRDRYRAGLNGTGWTDLDPVARDRALDMLADAYLPIILGVDLPLETLVTRRDEARAFWEDLSRNRTLMGREDQVLLLAGFLSPEGQMIVECWVAGPENPVTDDMMALIGATYDAPGIRMAQANLVATDTRPATELFVSRLSLSSPTLAATDALRTRITFDRGADL
jgi:hypothetical protein